MSSNPQSLYRESRWLVPLLAMTFVCTAMALGAGMMFGIPAAEAVLDYAARIWLMAPPTIILLFAFGLVRAALNGDRAPLSTMSKFVANRFATLSDAAATIVPILAIPLLMGAYGTIKQTIPLIHPFAWDDKLARADRMLFLGHQPWEWTHALAGNPTATVIIDRFYSGWVILLPCAVLAYAVVAPRDIRARFFLSFAAAWLLIGVVGGVLLASAGPCFAAGLGIATAPEYAPLMSSLAAIDRSHTLGAVQWQKVLWAAQVRHDYAFAMGISAMPSMHNAISFLYLASVGRASVLVRVAVGAFAAIMYFGSIHLGWHYALDGIVAWASMAAIWWGSGVYLRRIGYGGLGGRPMPGIPPTAEPARI